MYTFECYRGSCCTHKPVARHCLTGRRGQWTEGATAVLGRAERKRLPLPWLRLTRPSTAVAPSVNPVEADKRHFETMPVAPPNAFFSLFWPNPCAPLAY